MGDSNLFNKYGQNFDPEKVIFREGEVGEHMYIIQCGTVRITKNINGKEHTLTVLGKGDFFGEMAIVNRIRRTATAVAVEPVEVLSFNREGFLSMIEKNAKIALNVIDKLCRRLQHSNLQIQHLVKRNERSLIALNLYYAFYEHGMEAAVLKVQKVAERMALELEIPERNVMKHLKKLEEEEIIIIKENELLLGDKDRLYALSENVS
ncbi:MAG: Crp/Fnr family transcriptional regulator [Spirochaetia bacterium]